MRNYWSIEAFKKRQRERMKITRKLRRGVRKTKRLIGASFNFEIAKNIGKNGILNL